jgi:hypothetical protein
MRDLTSLSDYEFELLIADLLSAELGKRFETFARGRDHGIDLRHIRARSRRVDVVQCKHYQRSTYAQLRAAAREEKAKLDVLRPPPTTYRFVTSQPLTVGRKAELAGLLHPWVRRDDRVYGLEDIESLLRDHPQIERNHIKLWLEGSEQLRLALNASTYSRSRALMEGIAEALPRYVQNDAFFQADDILRESGVCVIAGPPGIGKTTLARILLASSTAAGYEPIEVSEDIEEAWSTYVEGEPQVFYYDDFLGRTSVGEKLRKNEDRRLVELMRLAGRSSTTRLLLTTREYILQQAVDLYEHLGLSGVAEGRFLLTLEDYSQLDRARIFYNHLYHSNRITDDAKASLVHDRAYLPIVRHHNYSPRVIEYITGFSARVLGPEVLDRYPEFCIEALENPARLWRHAFDYELSAPERALLLVLISMPSVAHTDDLEEAFKQYCEANEIDCRPPVFRRALKTLELTFIATRQHHGAIYVSVDNPSVVDFALEYLVDEPSDVLALLSGARFFEQIESLGGLGFEGAANPRAASLRSILDREGTLVAEAIARTINERPGDRSVLRVGISEAVVVPDDIDFAARLKVAMDVALADERALSILQDGLTDAWSSLIEAWQRGEGNPESAVRLCNTFLDDRARMVCPVDAVLAAAKGYLEEDLSSVADYRNLRDLWEVAPSAFSVVEWDAHRNSFATFADEALQSPDYILGTIEQAEELEALMDEWGVTYDDQALDEARESLLDRLRDAEGDFEPDEEPRGGQGANSHDQINEMDALFARLV